MTQRFYVIAGILICIGLFVLNPFLESHRLQITSKKVVSHTSYEKNSKNYSQLAKREGTDFTFYYPQTYTWKESSELYHYVNPASPQNSITFSIAENKDPAYVDSCEKIKKQWEDYATLKSYPYSNFTAKSIQHTYKNSKNEDHELYGCEITLNNSLDGNAFEIHRILMKKGALPVYTIRISYNVSSSTEEITLLKQALQAFIVE